MLPQEDPGSKHAGLGPVSSFNQTSFGFPVSLFIMLNKSDCEGSPPFIHHSPEQLDGFLRSLTKNKKKIKEQKNGNKKQVAKMRCGKCVKFPSCSDGSGKKCSWKTFWPACSALVKNLNFHFLQQIGEQPFAAEKKKSGKANADFCLREFFFFCFTTKVRIFPLHSG